MLTNLIVWEARALLQTSIDPFLHPSIMLFTYLHIDTNLLWSFWLFVPCTIYKIKLLLYKVDAGASPEQIGHTGDPI